MKFACTEASQRPRELGTCVRGEFPIFTGSAPLKHFLDSAATAQKPACVIERLSRFLSVENSNINRGAYSLSAHATELYDSARASVAEFLGAKSPRSIIFTKNATEAINLVAHASRPFLKSGDSIVLSVLEHHSNIVPWQMVSQARGVSLSFGDITDTAEIDLEKFRSLVRERRPSMVSITGLSNAFGTVPDIGAIIHEAKEVGAKVLVDASQLVAHFPVNVSALDVDFLVFSGHKIYGPMGIGVLYGKEELLSAMDPFLGGGDMIASVAVEGSTWADIPRKFEAGTPPVAEAIALGEALRFVKEIGFDVIKEHDNDLFARGWELMAGEPGVTLYGPGPAEGRQSSILPFNVVGVHPHDVATILDSVGVQVRAGHHCAMPALRRLNIAAMARASIGVYSCLDDFQALREGIRKAKKIFG